MEILITGSFSIEVIYYFASVCAIFLRQEEAKARALGPNVSVPIAQRVLLLGSGFTVAPCIEYLTRDKTLAVTIGEWIKVKSAYEPSGHQAETSPRSD